MHNLWTRMEHICIYSCSFTPQLFLIANVAECLLFSLNENCLENLIGAGEYYQEVQEGEEEEEVEEEVEEEEKKDEEVED